LKETNTFDGIVSFFHQVLERLLGKRTGKNTRYEMIDAALSAFSVFFTQNPSFLSYQKTMAETKGRSNAQSLFGVHQIPSDNHICDLLDEVKPEKVFTVFSKILQELEASQQLTRFRSFAGNLLMAMDGTEYFRSSKIHCPHCSSRKLRNGTIEYFHAVVTPVIVCPTMTQVLPLAPEFVQPQMGMTSKIARIRRQNDGCYSMGKSIKNCK
jgi:hypothetical protein